MPFDTAMEQWQAGLRRLEAAPFDERPVLDLVTRKVYEELRRRLGGAFTTEELAELYDAGTGWVSDLAVAVAPDAPFAWDVRIVGDAAFARYVAAPLTSRAGEGWRERSGTRRPADRRERRSRSSGSLPPVLRDYPRIYTPPRRGGTRAARRGAAPRRARR